MANQRSQARPLARDCGTVRPFPTGSDTQPDSPFLTCTSHCGMRSSCICHSRSPLSASTGLRVRNLETGEDHEWHEDRGVRQIAAGRARRAANEQSPRGARAHPAAERGLAELQAQLRLICQKGAGEVRFAPGARPSLLREVSLPQLAETDGDGCPNASGHTRLRLQNLELPLLGGISPATPVTGGIPPRSSPRAAPDFGSARGAARLAPLRRPVRSPQAPGGRSRANSRVMRCRGCQWR